MRFREHRALLADSLETTVEVEGRAGLVEHLRLKFWGSGWPVLDFDAIDVDPYAYDERAWGKTYIVTLAGYGVLGFTDERC